jgi:hypothetical protein
MSLFPWRKKNDEPPLDDLLDDLLAESPQSSNSGDEDDAAVPSNEEEKLLDQYVNSELPADDVDDALPEIDDLDDVQLPDVFLDTDTDDDKTPSDPEDVSDDVMSIFEDEVEQDEDMAALSKWLEELDVTELLEQARSVSRTLAERRSAN